MRNCLPVALLVWASFTLPAHGWGVITPTQRLAPERVELILVRDGKRSRLCVRARFGAVGKGARWIVPEPKGWERLLPEDDPFADLPGLRYAVRKEVYKRDLATWKKVQRGKGPARFWDRPSPPKKLVHDALPRLAAGKLAPLDGPAAASLPAGIYVGVPVTGTGWTPTVELRGPGDGLHLELLASFVGKTTVALTLLGDRDGFLPLGSRGRTKTFETLAGGNRVRPKLNTKQKRALKVLKATGPLPRAVLYRDHEIGQLPSALFADPKNWSLIDAVPDANDVSIRVLEAALKNLNGSSGKDLLAKATRFGLINVSQPTWRAKLQELCRKHADAAVPGLIAGLQRGDPNALELLVDGYVRSPQSYKPVPGQAKAWIPAAHHAGLWAALRVMAKTATETVVRRRLSWVAASLR